MSTTTNELSDHELGTVAGGVPGYPGLAPGQSINLSPFGGDWMWDYVGATGTLPRPPTPR